MKKIHSLLKRLSAKIQAKKTLYIVGVLGLGMIIGFGLGFIAFRHSDKKSTPPTETISTQVLNSRSDRLKKTYERNKTLVASDLKANTINAKQAEEINKKLEELYTFKKSVLSSEDASEAIQERRTELRRWTDVNKISKKYFLGIL